MSANIASQRGRIPTAERLLDPDSITWELMAKAALQKLYGVMTIDQINDLWKAISNQTWKAIYETITQKLHELKNA